MVEVKRTVKLVTEQNVIDKPSEVEGFPMRSWSIRVYLLDESGKEVPATLFEKATYKLHPSFKNPVQVVKSPPFQIREEGWGEFDMQIVLTAVDKGGDQTVDHDLNFQNERYESRHVLTFKNPKPAFLQSLKETGPVPGDENGTAKPKKSGGTKNAAAHHHDDDSSRKRKRGGAVHVDMDKLAEGMQKLGEEDLLHVITIIMDNKTSETYTKNDPEEGEFHVDLYTLPDSVIKSLWEFTVVRVDI
ncbi:MAG: hypothetical protein M1815_002804 [Lichina confinis]|nr:MAG: hypothetical protein M1815_002804 [Lichina confinis]